MSSNLCTATRHVIFSSNYHFSAISWNIFIQFEAIVYERLFILIASIFIITNSRVLSSVISVCSTLSK